VPEKVVTFGIVNSFKKILDYILSAEDCKCSWGEVIIGTGYELFFI
jgi:hypothetical protein